MFLLRKRIIILPLRGLRKNKNFRGTQHRGDFSIHSVSSGVSFQLQLRDQRVEGCSLKLHACCGNGDINRLGSCEGSLS